MQKIPYNLLPLCVLLLSIAALFAACSAARTSPGVATNLGIPLEDCKLSAPGSTMQLDARCGKLKVFENRFTARGREIELNVAIIPAISRSPSPDPLFFISGGPGEAATQSFVSLSSAFESINQKRDIVLVDQRGTGKSHPLQCAFDEEAPDSKEGNGITKALQDCLGELDADARFYTTAIAMDDLDQVRATLGYEKINLYGASYGTRAALAYLRQHPDRVRTVILDGVAPPNWTLGPAAAGDGQRALQMLFARCLAEAGCRQAFPNIQTEFQSVLGELQTQGIEVNLDHPVTGAPTMVTLTRDQFTSTIHLMSYTPETAALIPLMIHAAFERQDFRPLAAQALTSFDTVESSLSNGMRFSVVCAEDVPFYAQEFPSQGYLGDYIIESFIKICEMWPRGEILADFKQPVRSDIPVLLLSGEADPVTPPSNGELTAKTLSNYEHLVVPGMGHINIFRGCIPRIAAAFVDIGSTQGLDTACVENISPMPFFMNFSGSTP